MNVLTLILGIITITGLTGSASIFFLRGRGNESIRLLQINIQAYKDAELLKDKRIAYLEGQLLVKDETIKRLLNDSK